MPSEQSVAISVDVVRGKENCVLPTEGFNPANSVSEAFWASNAGDGLFVDHGRDYGVSGDQNCGSKTGKFIFQTGQKYRFSDVRLAFGRLETLLRDMIWGAFQRKVTVVFSSPGRVFAQNYPALSV